MQCMTREALYEQVWETPFTELAEAFAINSSWLKKLCQQAAIPLPKIGYWQKLRAGNPVTRTPLPLRPPGASAIVVLASFGWTWMRSEKEKLSDPIIPEPEFSESVETVVARTATRLGTTRTTSELGSFEGWPPSEHNRLKLLNALRLALREIGIDLRISRRGQDEMKVSIGQTDVTFRLTEESSGFTLELYEDRACNDIFRKFRDQKDSSLGNQLSEIINAILTLAELQYRWAAVGAHRWSLACRTEAENEVRERRAAAKRQREQQRIEREGQARELLFSQADDWRTAHNIREFVADILQHTETDTTRQKLASWADWALRQADLIDPVKQGALLRPPRKR